MKVTAKKNGFIYGRFIKEGESFTLRTRLDDKAKAADHKADVEAQFSSKWMEKA